MNLLKKISLLLIVIIGCSSPRKGSINQHRQSKQYEKKGKANLGKWKKQITAGKIGLANYVDGTLKNLDAWPFTINTKRELQQLDLKKSTDKVGTCGYFLTLKKNYSFHVQFLLGVHGNTSHIHFLNKVGPCKSFITEIVKNLQFTPAVNDGEPLPALIIYPVQVQLSFK
jgi:hypothetical protein